MPHILFFSSWISPHLSPCLCLWMKSVRIIVTANDLHFPLFTFCFFLFVFFLQKLPAWKNCFLKTGKRKWTDWTRASFWEKYKVSVLCFKTESFSIWNFFLTLPPPQGSNQRLAYTLTSMSRSLSLILLIRLLYSLLWFRTGHHFSQWRVVWDVCRAENVLKTRSYIGQKRQKTFHECV